MSIPRRHWWRRTGDEQGDIPALEALGFSVPVPRVSVGGGPGPDSGEKVHGDAVLHPAPATQSRGSYTGVWLSRYEYVSSSRGDATFEAKHHVVLLQHGDRLTVRSLPGSAAGELTMDLSVDGDVITGTWTERTDPGGYYRGARYHGAVQMLAEPTGRRLRGKWVGFGKDMDVNTGVWELVFLDGSTNKAALDRYNVPPE